MISYSCSYTYSDSYSLVARRAAGCAVAAVGDHDTININSNSMITSNNDIIIIDNHMYVYTYVCIYTCMCVYI